MARSPHLVLDGAVLAARMVGARQAVIVVHRDVREIMDEAAAERRRARLDRVRVEVCTAADGFVAGQASAVVRWVERGVPAPTATPPGSSNAAWAAGRRWCRTSRRSRTSRSSPATAQPGSARSARRPSPARCWSRCWARCASRACSRSRPARRSARCSSWRAARPRRCRRCCSAATSAPGWTRRRRVGLPFSSAGLADLGAGPGAGLIAALPAGACGLAETARVVRYLAGESAGQCGPCRFGLSAVAGELEQIAEGRTADLGLLRRWLGQVDGRGGCAHPSGVVRLVRSALRTFGAELSQHAGGSCGGTARVLPVPSPGPR